MSSPFEVLGIPPWSDPEEIRAAYRRLVKACHPDRVQDPEKKNAAQEEMIRLNLAYEEALRLSGPRRSPSVYEEVPASEAIHLAEKMLSRGNPESALHHLMRSTDRDAAWYYTQGRVMMELEQFETAHQSYREAVRRSPENNEYRRGALDAAIALKKSKTIPGKVRMAFHHMRKR